MSAKREVTTALDTNLIAKIAKEKYYEVKEKANVRGYNGALLKDNNGNVIVADIVISTYGDTFDIGIIDNGNGTVTVVCDEHGGYVRQKLMDILPEYIERELDGRFIIEEIKKGKNELELEITR